MGFEDEVHDTDDAVKAANEYAENQRKEQALRQAETIQQMEKNKAEDEKKKQLVELIAAVVNEVNKPIIENLKEHGDQIQYLANELGSQREVLNKIVTALNPNAGTNPANTDQTAQIAQAATVLDHPVVGKLLDKVADRLFAPEQQGVMPLIPQEVINEKMTKAFMDDLNTGESIRQFITDALKKKATREVVKQSLGQIGKTDFEQQHIPE